MSLTQFKQSLYQLDPMEKRKSSNTVESPLLSLPTETIEKNSPNDSNQQNEQETKPQEQDRPSKESKCVKDIPKTIYTSQALQTANQKHILNNPEQPLVAWVPDWRTMKDDQTGEILINPETGENQLGYMPELVESYTQAFSAAGIRLLLLTNDQKIQDWSDKIDGIMIPGGRDIDPALYGEENTHSVFDKEDSRKRFELCKNWVTEGDPKMPIFGICYGFQVLNIIYGGKMNQHLANSEEHLYKCRDFVPRKGSHLHKSTNGKNIHSACFHHQNVENIPSCLKPNSYDTLDGSVHGLEWHDDSRTIISTLWHPELGKPYVDDADMDVSQSILKYFAGKCEEYRSSRVLQNL
jgi:putative glutamine amidotransferase